MKNKDLAQRIITEVINKAKTENEIFTTTKLPSLLSFTEYAKNTHCFDEKKYFENCIELEAIVRDLQENCSESCLQSILQNKQTVISQLTEISLTNAMKDEIRYGNGFTNVNKVFLASLITAFLSESKTNRKQLFREAESIFDDRQTDYKGEPFENLIPIGHALVKVSGIVTDLLKTRSLESVMTLNNLGSMQYILGKMTRTIKAWNKKDTWVDVINYVSFMDAVKSR